jgi:hypothetical protein
MHIAVFGPDLPIEMPIDFADALDGVLREMVNEPSGSSLMLSKRWMVNDCMALALHHDVSIESFETLFASKDDSYLGVCALNACELAIFLLPHHTIVDEETGHNHPIVDWACLAYCMERPFVSDQREVLQRRLEKRFSRE